VRGAVNNAVAIYVSNPTGAASFVGPCALLGFEGEQTIGVATVDGSLCLTHTSHTPGERLLETMSGVLKDVVQSNAQSLGQRRPSALT
jgi:hypothetical protein